MKRVNMFLTILIASIAALIAATAIGFAIFSQAQNPANWMSQMWGGSSNYGGMGGMMGQPGTHNIKRSATLLWRLVRGFNRCDGHGDCWCRLLFVVSPNSSWICRSYLNYTKHRSNSANSTNGATAYESVAKTLTEEERKVVEVLNSHQGKYLQKYIRNETGLSRLQTHRIIARLADRGIVSLEKIGNTNQVYLANWLTKQ